MENNNILRSLFFELRANLPRWVLQKLMPQTFFLSWISSLKVILKEKYSLIEIEVSTWIMNEGL